MLRRAGGSAVTTTKQRAGAQNFHSQTHARGSSYYLIRNSNCGRGRGCGCGCTTEVVKLLTQNTYLRISDKLPENPFQPGRAPPWKSLLAGPSELRWWTPTKISGKIDMRPVQAK